MSRVLLWRNGLYIVQTTATTEQDKSDHGSSSEFHSFALCIVIARAKTPAADLRVCVCFAASLSPQCDVVRWA